MDSPRLRVRMWARLFARSRMVSVSFAGCLASMEELTGRIGQVRGHVSGCVNTSQVTGTGTGASGVPSATGMVHNHTTSAPVPDGTEDIEDDDSGSAGLAFHASAACVGLAVSYIVIAVL